MAFAAEQNARAAVGAEAYYRAMVRGGPESWNIRDTHMAHTLDRLREHRATKHGGSRAKAVVWAHNTTSGTRGSPTWSTPAWFNLGQLARERYGDADTVLVGFGTHHGQVLAAPRWGSPVRSMTVPPARTDSTEASLHEDVEPRHALFVFPPDLPGWAAEERTHRAIGFVYSPDAERWENYVPTGLGRRYDAFL